MLDNKDALNLDLSKFKKIHFIGITSAFNSFCANYLIEQGYTITASEFHQDSDEAKEWIKRGILYPGGHNAKYITDDVDLVIIPNGPIPGNPECEETEKRNLTAITISQLTGIISKNFKVIAIAGTHGKTTTSSLIAWMLFKETDIKPNFIIGDVILGWNQSWNYNPKSEYLVIEACEYKKQFLCRAPQPDIVALTNIDLDHTDIFPTQEEYNDAFAEFISTAKTVVLDSKGNNIQDIVNRSNKKFNILDISDIRDKYKDVKSSLIGKYNHENILRACGVAEILEIKPQLEDFPGVNFRFQYMGKTVNNMPAYSDYAHNPEKIEACLGGVKETYPDKKILLVWEPHSFERTYTFKDAFIENLKLADTILIPQIYAPLREKDRFKDLISEKSFVEDIKKEYPQKDVRYTESFEKTANIVKNSKFNDDYISIFASAGQLKEIFKMIDLEK